MMRSLPFQSLRRLPAPSARDTGPVGVTEVQPTMVYRASVFLRQEIETINNVAIAPGSAVDLALNDLGISLSFATKTYEWPNEWGCRNGQSRRLVRGPAGPGGAVHGARGSAAGVDCIRFQGGRNHLKLNLITR